jgi:hypothetical protein
MWDFRGYSLTAQADADSNQQPENSKVRHATHSATQLGIMKFRKHVLKYLQNSSGKIRNETD